jgi:hypothetical protein
MGRPALGQRIADRPAVSWRGGFRHPAPSKPQPSASATRCHASCPTQVRKLPSAWLLSGRPGPTNRPPSGTWPARRSGRECCRRCLGRSQPAGPGGLSHRVARLDTAPPSA